jgi:DNA-binding MarR family transcriptional regulator
VGRLARALRRAGSADLTAGQLSALAVLEREGPLRLGDLAAREGVAAPTMTRVVGSLEERGLVRRRADPRDGRAHLVAVTGDGAELVSGVRGDRAAAIAERLGRLPETQRRALLDALDALDALAGDG